MKLAYILIAALVVAACGPSAASNAVNAANTAASNTVQPMASNEAKPSDETEPAATNQAKPPEGGNDTGANPVTNAADQAAAAACQARGGIYGPVCLGGEMMCVERFPDAGRPCTDGSQCRGGSCYYEGPTPSPGQRVTGACVQSTNPCGCHARVENGQTQGALCVD